MMAKLADGIRLLEAGENIQIRMGGSPMRGRVEVGQVVTVAPAGPEDGKVGAR